MGARQLKERLFNEAENNVTMKIEELEDKSGVEVSGRGILHLSVLMESMRREGFEFQVGRPRVLFKKDENGNKMEPVEQAVVECPDEYSGKVVEVFGTSGGIMTSMDTSGIVTHLEFKIPTRGIMGLKNRIMNVTHGEGVFYHTFLEYGPYAGEIGNRQNGAMISMTTEKAVAYALGTLQERGQLFVEPGTECYEGMIVGERSKAGDMVVNIARTKNLATSALRPPISPSSWCRPAPSRWRRRWSTSPTTSWSRLLPRTFACASVCSSYRPQEGCRPRRSGQQISAGFYSFNEKGRRPQWSAPFLVHGD